MSLIRSTHLNRQAVIYIRQSSPIQVEQNLESQQRQYQLAERAEHLGWPSQQRLIIDDDLGLSGAYSHNRPAYQRLVSLVALWEVGIIFGLEVSRLARNCLDCYQLLAATPFAEIMIKEDRMKALPDPLRDRETEERPSLLNNLLSDVG